MEGKCALLKQGPTITQPTVPTEQPEQRQRLLAFIYCIFFLILPALKIESYCLARR